MIVGMMGPGWFNYLQMRRAKREADEYAFRERRAKAIEKMKAQEKSE